MNDECNFVIVRHGQTTANAAQIIQGQQDWPLNEQGKAQALAVAEALAGEDFAVAYSSDLSRAMDTARAIASKHPGLNVTPEPDLREWCFGTWEGLPIAELAPKLVLLRDENLALRPPGGETCLDLRKRVADCLLRLAQEHLGQTVLVVSHGGAIAQMFRMMFQALPGMRLPTTTNGGITRLKWLAAPLGKAGNAADLLAGSQQGWQMLSWNETTHLTSHSAVEGV